MIAPWYTFHSEIRLILEKDSDIKVGDLSDGDDKGNYTYFIFVKRVSEDKKVIALKLLMENPCPIGNITVQATVFGSNEN